MNRKVVSVLSALCLTLVVASFMLNLGREHST